MHAAFAIALAVLAAAAAWSDLRRRRVGNRLCALVCAIGMTNAALSGAPALLCAVAGVAVGLGLLLPAFAARWIGGGDVKLVAALGAWLGPWGIALAAAIGLALGGILAAAIAIAGGAGREVAGHLRASIATMTAPVAPRRARALTVPLALPLAAAALLVFFGGLS